MDPLVPRIYTLTELGVFVGVVTTSITGAVVAILTAWRTGGKVDKVGAVLDTVEKNTNSKLTRQDEQISQLLSEVKSLTAHIATQDKVRAVLAAERSTSAPSPSGLGTAAPARVATAEPTGQIVVIPEQVLPVETTTPPSRIIQP